MFSCLMSVYHKDDISFFKVAVDSVINQTVQPQQFVLVCDGPLGDDYLREISIIEKRLLNSTIDFVVVKLEKNVGLGLALQSGMLYCDQDFVIRMDSDDISRLNRIELTKEFIKENPSVDIFGSYIEEFNRNPGDLSRVRRVPLLFEDIVSFGKKRNPMNHVTVCMRREKILEIGNYESVLFHEDYFLWVKSIMKGLSIANADEILVDVRVGNDLIGRRIGVSYLKHEVNFAKNCLDINYFSKYDIVKYLFPRLFLRFLPKSYLSLIYKTLRA
ncbi:glycosyltransferase [Vibrio splendidus]|uniref:glycosyltransferase n=1 Tax=Vibrio splendidus TaxID=29497 RepID=UPI00076A2292|nr:glycosyltransferase [Vibrio splendidus]CAH6817218.1 Glyco_trans_2-like domain-containing protein [Vibrio chagasii]